MNKKILILNGSPRKNGNTKALIRAFEKGAGLGGNETSTFELNTLTINGCVGCYGGGKSKEQPCVLRDDMDQIYQKFWESDCIVFASPLYFWNFSGQLITVLDRLFAIAECDPKLKQPEKETVLLMAAEGSDFELAIKFYYKLLQKLNWKDRGMLLAGGVLKEGEISQSEHYLKEAERIGQNI